MSDLTAKEVIETVEWLERDVDHKAMRDSAERRHALVNMNLQPDLPEHMAGVSEPSAMLIWLRDQISADMLPFPTETTVTVFDPNQQKQQQADKIERWLSLWQVRVDAAKRITSDARDHQMLSPYCALILRCGGPDEDFPWAIEIPDPDTCFFPIDRAPFRPTVFGRRFKQLVRDAEKAYSGKKNYKDGSWDNRAGDWRFVNGEWRMGLDRPGDAAMPPTSSDRFELREFYELHEDEDVYIVGENKDGRTSEILWQGKSYTGGPSVIICPGVYSSAGPISERLRPFFWPAMQCVMAINRIRGIRASRSEANKPDVLIERSPEMAQALATQGIAGANLEGIQAQLDAGMPNMVYVNGKPMAWNMEPDPDLDKREASWQAELNRIIDSWQTVSEPEIVKDSTANSFLTNMESKKKRLSPLLLNLDWCWNELKKMVVRSVVEYDKEFPLYATSDDVHVGLKRGQGETIGPKDVTDFEKDFWLTTETRSVTEAETRARLQDWAYKHEIGISTMLEGIEIVYPDAMRQIEALYVDAGVLANTDWVKAQNVTATQERIRLMGGVDIGGVGMPHPAIPPPGVSGPPPAAPAGVQPMQPATVPGPMVGSGAVA